MNWLRIWKEAVVAEWGYYPGIYIERLEYLSQENRDLNQAPSEYEPIALPLLHPPGAITWPVL